MNGISIAAVGIGAALGAWLRWAVGLWLNPLFDAIALGTLAVNIVGGLLMGMAMGAANEFAHWSPELRLFVTTGFLGGLTTFSTFSGEASVLLERGDYTWTGVLIGAHVVGSIAATLCGLWLIRMVLRAG